MNIRATTVTHDICHVRKHKAVFQVGTQQRSMEMNRVACEFVRTGGLGKLKYVLAVNYSGVGPTPSVDSYEEKPIPSGFNWNLHLKRSEWRPFGSGATRGRNYVGGQMTNWGAHGVDQIRWALGKDDIKAMPLQGHIGHKTPFPITITSSWASSRA